MFWAFVVQRTRCERTKGDRDLFVNLSKSNKRFIAQGRIYEMILVQRTSN